MPNIYEPDLKDDRRPAGFRTRRQPMGSELGSERLGCTLWEVAPGEAAYPYHFHLGDEELLVVVRGRPTLRAPDGERRLAEGEVVSFGIGERGAHQLRNDGDEPVRFLAISTKAQADVVVYPDSDKIGIGASQPDGGRLRAYFRREQAVGYWDGEADSAAS
jgi:uncharacterized cupin superfamily protein